MRRGPVDLRLLRLAGRHRRALVCLVALSVIDALTVVAAAALIARVVVEVLAPGPWWRSLAALAGVLAVRAVVARLRPVAAHAVATGVITDARTDVLATVARRGPAWVAGRAARAEPVEVTALLATGLDPLRPWFTHYLPALVVAALVPPLVLVLMATFDLTSAAVVLVTLPLVPLFAALVGWATERRAKAQYHRGGHLAGHFLDVVRGLATLKLFDRARRQVEAVRDTSQRYAHATTKVLSVAFLSSTALDLVATISVGLVAVGAGVRLAGGEMALWPALAVILLAPEAYRPLREAGAQFHESAEATAVLDQLQALEVIPAGGRREPAGVRGESAGVRGEPAGVREPAGGHGESTGPPAPGRDTPVGMRGVRVRYPGRRQDLRLPDLQVRAGELVVLVGPSGSGKTTMLRVLAGVQPPRQGTTWGKHVHYVPQRPSLPMAATVGAALEVERHGRDRVEQVLARLGLAVHALPAGLETSLTQDGEGISAGQRHRIALARAVLTVTGPGAPARPVLLLDEPTAHLDAASEAAVADLLRSLTGHGVTVVAAAHRSRLIDLADRQVSLRPAPPSSTPAPRGSMAGGPAGATPLVAPEHAPSHTPSHTPRLAPSDRAAAAGAAPAGRGRWWARLRPSTRFTIAALTGAASLLAAVGLTVAAAWLIIRAEARPPILSLSMAVVAVRGFAVARPLLGYLQRLAAHDAGLTMLADWRARVVADLLPRVPGRLTERRGRLLTRVVRDVDLRLAGLVSGAVPLGAGALAMIVIGGAAGLIAPGVVPALILAGVAGAVVVPWQAVRADRRLAAERERAEGDLQDALIEVVDNAEELTGSRRDDLVGQVHRRARRYERAEGRAARLDGRVEAGAQGAAAALIAGTTILAAGLWADGSISGELLGMLVLGSSVLTEALLMIAPAARDLAAGDRARRRLTRLGHLPATGRPEAHHPHDADPHDTRLHDTRLHDSRPHDARLGAGAGEATGLQVVNLTVAWPDSTAHEAPVREACLTVPTGGTAVIEGASGSGKSTLAAALVGLLEPTAGAIRLNGRDIARTPGPCWRRRVSLAGGADHVFSSTLRANLLLARPDAGDDLLLQALRRAHLEGWFNGLTDGLDTWLDSGGRVLSGGERRRLVLARALLRDPQVLVLDEPTEGLDPPTAEELMTHLRRWAAAGNRSLVVLTHRLDGLQDVDHRYRLHGGRLQPLAEAIPG